MVSSLSIAVKDIRHVVRDGFLACMRKSFSSFYAATAVLRFADTEPSCTDRGYRVDSIRLCSTEESVCTCAV
jgi:hypothetical protein